jgi:hypothetical protein
VTHGARTSFRARAPARRRCCRSPTER